MARTRQDDERLLSKEEQELIVQTRHPLVKQLSDTDLSELLKRLRTHRDRAREIGKFRRRELRGQALTTGMAKPFGLAAPETHGHSAKRSLLSAAVKRANKESERRRAAGRSRLS